MPGRRPGAAACDGLLTTIRHRPGPTFGELPRYLASSAIEALLGSVIELGCLTETPTTHIDSVYALVKLLSHTVAAEKLCVRAMTREVLERALQAVKTDGQGIAVD